MNGQYFAGKNTGMQPISTTAYGAAHQLAKDGFISTSSKYRQVSRPVGDFAKYGYEWHARCSGESIELDTEVYAAFREVAPTRCSHCGKPGDDHVEDCAYLKHSQQSEIAMLRSKLAAAMAEIADLRSRLGDS